MDRNDTNTVGTHGLCVRCIKGYSVMVLTGTDAQTVRPYRSRFRGSAHQTTGFTTRRPDDFPIPLKLFWDFFRGYFLFPREERKNSSDLSFDSSEVSFDSSEEIFLSSLGNRK